MEVQGQCAEWRSQLRGFLAAGAAKPTASGGRGLVALRNGSGTMTVPSEMLRRFAAEGMLRHREGLIELAGGGAGVTTALVPDPVDGTPLQVMVRNGESPLATLARLKDRSGRPFLGEDQFRAGERLRVDYTRGRIMPRLGVNWDSGPSGGGGGGGLADLTDAALAARQRVDAALRAVGPELSGLLVDVCCFLKGLEQVERERGWPVRSGKVMVKTALAALARHYGASGRAAKAVPVLHWGTEDYRPKIDEIGA